MPTGHTALRSEDFFNSSFIRATIGLPNVTLFRLRVLYKGTYSRQQGIRSNPGATLRLRCQASLAVVETFMKTRHVLSFRPIFIVNLGRSRPVVRPEGGEVTYNHYPPVSASSAGHPSR